MKLNYNTVENYICNYYAADIVTLNSFPRLPPIYSYLIVLKLLLQATVDANICLVQRGTDQLRWKSRVKKEKFGIDERYATTASIDFKIYKIATNLFLRFRFPSYI